jgi:rod shape-determining protein MreC
VASVAPARRSGFLLFGLVLGHLLIISGQVDGGQGVSLLERLILGALSPAQRFVGGGVRGFADAWHAYLDLRGVRVENKRLQERVDALEQLLQEKQDRVREAERLRGLLAMKTELKLDSVAAEVISREGVPWFRTVMVGQGSQAGVRLNAAVVTPQGIVGRVVAVGRQAARVQLLLDRDCSAGVLVGEGRVSGVVQGQVGFADQGTSELLVKYVTALAKVEVGDEVVTSGLDGIYPKGLLVGRVRSVAPASGLFKDVLVTPAVAFDRMEEVLILRSSEQDRTLTEALR